MESFSVLQSHYTFKPLKRNIKDIQKIFKSYEIDIDFAHHSNGDSTIQVFTKISINQGEKSLPGYQLFVEGAAIFKLDESAGIPDNDKENLKYFSTVNILIGYLRNTLMTITSSAPVGPYLLPPINIADLFRKKSEK